MKLEDLAQHLGATLKGDHSVDITGVASIETAGPGEITFVANPKYASLARTTRASAILVEPAFPDIPAATLRIANPYLAFARAIEVFYQAPSYPPGIHPTAVIAPTAKIGANAHIGSYVVVGDHAVIGDNAVLLPHVVIYPHVRAGDNLFAHAHAVIREYCQLGDNVVLQNGAIIGADGFGFAKQADGSWYKILQSGPAILEDSVEVQANACIDRASIGETRIHSGAKIDNLVQVGHGSTVGKDTLLCAQVGLAGSPSADPSSSPDRSASPVTAPSATVLSPQPRAAFPAMSDRARLSAATRRSIIASGCGPSLSSIDCQSYSAT
jgi:UDP-3-O-[3-hydroxymyristoyl] glucosamine N-acyltransferase